MFANFKPKFTDFIVLLGVVLVSNVFFYRLPWVIQLMLWPFFLLILSRKVPNLNIKGNRFSIRRKSLDFMALLSSLIWFIVISLPSFLRDEDPVSEAFISDFNYLIWFLLIIFYVRNYRLFCSTYVSGNEYGFGYFRDKKNVGSYLYEIEYVKFENSEVKIKLLDSEEFSDSYHSISDEEKMLIQSIFDHNKAHGKSLKELTFQEKLRNKTMDKRLTATFIIISVLIVGGFLYLLLF